MAGRLDIAKGAAQHREFSCVWMEGLMSVSYDIFCDGCCQIINGSHISAAIARKQATQDGILFRVGRKEYCRQCFLAMKKEGDDE